MKSRIGSVMNGKSIIEVCDHEYSMATVIENFCPQDFGLDGDGYNCAKDMEKCIECWNRLV